MKKMTKKELTHKQEKAIEYFLKGNDKTTAYKMAGYGGKSSPKTLSEEACKLFKLPHVQARIKELQDAVKNRLKIDLAYVTKGIIESIEIARMKEDPSNMRQGYAELAKLFDLNKEKQHDRLISQRDREAVLENLRERLVDEVAEDQQLH